MTNRTKWLVAVPFALAIGGVVPALIASEWLWFLHRWQDALFACLTVGMWLVATAFVDLERPRGRRDRANALIPLALIVAVPIAVWDRFYGLGRLVPAVVSIAAVALGLVSIILGFTARVCLGPVYSPRPGAAQGNVLVCRGPYRYIRHPLYLAALFWALSWPLILGSVVAPIVTLTLVLPAVLARVRREEADLLRVHGQAFVVYCEQSWRLIPFLY